MIVKINPYNKEVRIMASIGSRPRVRVFGEIEIPALGEDSLAFTPEHPSRLTDITIYAEGEDLDYAVALLLGEEVLWSVNHLKDYYQMNKSIQLEVDQYEVDFINRSDSPVTIRYEVNTFENSIEAIHGNEYSDPE
jgi:hypothetical protein